MIREQGMPSPSRFDRHVRFLRAIGLFLVLMIVFAIVQPLSAQQDTFNYLKQIGTPTSVSPHPVESGFINLGNGNLHLEIPLGTFPQRGGTAPLTFKLVYDSRIWRHFGPSSVWNSNNVQGGVLFNQPGQPTWGGWRLQDSVRGWLEIDPFVIQNCGQGAYLFWHTIDGSSHFLDFIPTNVQSSCGPNNSTGSAPSTDSTGFLYSVTNFTFGSSSPQGTILASDGSQVFPAPTDTNGNSYSADANGNVIDTIGRTPLQVTNN